MYMCIKFNFKVYRDHKLFALSCNRKKSENSVLWSWPSFNLWPWHSTEF